LTSSEDIRLVQVHAPDAVSLVTTGDIKDADTRQAVDERDMERLKGMWERLGILAKEGADYDAQVNAQLDVACGNTTAAYHNYFTLQKELASEGREAYLARIAADGSRGFRDNPDNLAPEALNALALARATTWLNESLIGLANQLSKVDPALLTAPYAAGFKLTRANLTPEQKTRLTALAQTKLWDKASLSSIMSDALFGGTTSTLVTETANVVGKNVWLKANNIGSLGQDRAFVINNYKERWNLGETNQNWKDHFSALEWAFLNYATDSQKNYDTAQDSLVIRLGGSYTVENYQQKLSGGQEFTELDKFHLWTTESPDQNYDTSTDSMNVTLSDDVNVLLLGNEGSLSLHAKGYALIGSGVLNLNVASLQDLRIDAAVTEKGQLRIKADGNLYTTSNEVILDIPDGASSTTSYTGLHAGVLQTAADPKTGKPGAYLVAEASNGDLGENYDKALLVGSHYNATYRAGGSIYLTSLPKQELTIEKINAERNVAISTAETITFIGDSVVFRPNFVLTTEKQVIIDSINAVTINDKVEINGVDIIGKGASFIIHNGAQLNAQRDVSFTALRTPGTADSTDGRIGMGGTVTAQTATFAGGTVVIAPGSEVEVGALTLQLVDQGGGEAAQVVVDDEASVKITGEAPIIVQGSSRTDDLINFSNSMLPVTWTVDGQYSGSFTQGALAFKFSSIENVLAGNGGNTVLLRDGGRMSSMSLGTGRNVINASGMSLANHWKYDGATLVGRSGSQGGVDSLTGVNSLVGSEGGDTLEFNSPLAALWRVTSNYMGTLNGMEFSNMHHAMQTSPGGSFWLNAGMDSIQITATPFSLMIQPAGNFKELNYASGVAIIDMRPRNMEQPPTPPEIVFGDKDKEQDQTRTEQPGALEQDSTRSSLDQPSQPATGSSDTTSNSGVTLPSSGVGEHNTNYFAQTEPSSSSNQQPANPDGQATGEAGSGTQAPAQGTAPAAQDGAPAAQDGAPAAQDGAPAAQDGAPAAQDGAPAAQDGAPAAQDGAPAGQDGDSTGQDGDSTGQDGDSTGQDGDSTGQDGDSTGQDGDSTGQDGTGEASGSESTDGSESGAQSGPDQSPDGEANEDKNQEPRQP
ncbi:MAG: hypothetical protein PHI96_08855, partial [Desulfovibrio sp.]|nr:hypothetical protein [Desulfovibrio sp.]